MTLNDEIEKYLQLKEECSKLEKKVSKQRDVLDGYLKREGKTRLKTDKYFLESKEITTHRISKNTVPKSVWEEYSVESSYSVLKINKIDGGKIIRKSV